LEESSQGLSATARTFSAHLRGLQCRLTPLRLPTQGQAHPNAVSGTLDAIEARFGIPVLYTSQYRPLAEEKAASWLSKHFTYWYLEKEGLRRVLQEGDL
jgi:hypothetical protein